MDKKLISKVVLSSLVSTTILSSLTPVSVLGSELSENITEEKNETAILSLDSTSEDFKVLAKAISESESDNRSEEFEEALLMHHNEEYSLALEKYDAIITNETFPDKAVGLIEWLVSLAENQEIWIEQEFNASSEELVNDSIETNSEEADNVDDSSDSLNESTYSTDEEQSLFSLDSKQAIENSDNEVKDKEESAEENDGKVHSKNVHDESLSDDLFEGVVNAPTATTAWNTAQEFKSAFPTDSRLPEAIDSAAQRVFAMGQSSQRRDRLPLARQYYSLLMNEALVTDDLRESASNLYTETVRAENGTVSNELFNSVMEASTATQAWNTAQEFKSSFPTDSRLPEVMDSAAQRIFAMGQSSHRRDRFEQARHYYALLMNEEAVNSDLRKSAAELYEFTVKAENGTPAEELYLGVMNAPTASEAWRASQEFKDAYPDEPRLPEAIDSAAQRIFSMGRSSQRQNRLPLARQYYTLLINESLVSVQLRESASNYYNEAVKAENGSASNELFENVLNAPTASAAWNAAQEFKKSFPNDARLPEAIDSAAQRIYSMGLSNHRRGNFNTANIYYAQLLGEQNISTNLRNEVTELNKLSGQKIKLRSVNEYYNDSVNASTATSAWNIAVEGLKYNPNNAKLIDALNTAAQRQFSLGQSQHRNGNFSSALLYYNRVANNSDVRSDLKDVVSIFRRKAQQNSAIMTSIDYSNQSLRAGTASNAWNTAIEGLIAYPNNRDIINALNEAANRNLSLGRSQFRQGNYASARTYYNRVANEPAVSEAIRTLAGVFRQQLTPNYKHTVYIDAGHGGKDPGASFGGVREKDLNLSTSLLLRTELEKLGYNVVMSRETDVFIEMSDRPFEANSISADIFVSIHYNSMGGMGTARGIESFIFHRVASGFGQETNRNNFRTEDPRIDESLRLADAMHANLISDTNMRDRGVKGNNFNVLRNSHIPAMLTELAFLDNAADRSIAVTHEFQLSAARAMARGIDEYFNR